MINLDTPHAKATIAWLGANGASAGTRLASAIETAGYRLFDPPTTGPVDIVAIDLRTGGGSPVDIADLVGAARRLAPTAGILIIASSDADREGRAFLRKHGDVCYYRKDVAPVVTAIRERLRLATLADEMGERLKSLIADGRTISFNTLASEGARLSVLIAGRPSPLTLSACNAVRAAASQTTCVFSAGQVMRALDHSRFDGAIFIPSDENDLLLALARALRRHREHRRLPVILASLDEDLLDRCAARDGFDQILAGHLESDLAVRLATTARRAHMANAMRRFLRSAEGGGAEGAVGARLFAHHAIRLFRRADATRQPLSLVGLSLSPRAGETTDAVAKALLEAQRTASRLVRAEDMIARLTPTTLVVLTRGANGREAAKIAERLEGVIAGTLLRATLDIARIDSAAVERAIGDSVETCVAALIRRLRSIRNEARAAQ